jgi:hypothetical protein
MGGEWSEYQAWWWFPMPLLNRRVPHAISHGKSPVNKTGRLRLSSAVTQLAEVIPGRSPCPRTTSFPALSKVPHRQFTLHPYLAHHWAHIYWPVDNLPPPSSRCLCTQAAPLNSAAPDILLSTLFGTKEGEKALLTPLSVTKASSKSPHGPGLTIFA